MYWQVYLHNTVLSSEILLLNILQRARKLAGQGVELFCTPSLGHFLFRPVSRNDFFGEGSVRNRPELSEIRIGPGPESRQTQNEKRRKCLPEDEK